MFSRIKQRSHRQREREREICVTSFLGCIFEQGGNPMIQIRSRYLIDWATAPAFGRCWLFPRLRIQGFALRLHQEYELGSILYSHLYAWSKYNWPFCQCFSCRCAASHFCTAARLGIYFDGWMMDITPSRTRSSFLLLIRLKPFSFTLTISSLLDCVAMWDV